MSGSSPQPSRGSDDDSSFSPSPSLLMDITDLIRCAALCLSPSDAFMPLLDGCDGAASPAAAGCECADEGSDAGGSIVSAGVIDDNAASVLLGDSDGTDARAWSSPLDDAERALLEVRGVAIDRTDGVMDLLSALPALPAFDLRDAMTALELGDKRMDCCEVPLPHEEDCDGGEEKGEGRGGTGENCDGREEEEGNELESRRREGGGGTEEERGANEHKKFDATPKRTIPPRIAPQSLSDGTPPPVVTATAAPLGRHSPPKMSSPSSPLSPLFLESSPCPSLLPHWTGLSLTDALLLALVQLSALEAYVGTDNGGSNAAETLYCVMWCHDGVLADMERRLGEGGKIWEAADGDDEEEGDEIEREDKREMISQKRIREENGKGKANAPRASKPSASSSTTAQWILMASSLGVIRVAESVRWAVVHGDIYEEEDFGVAMHNDAAPTAMEIVKGGAAASSEAVAGINGITPSATASSSSSFSMNFCPALGGNQIVEAIWDEALRRLEQMRGRSTDDGSTQETTVDALIAILEYQRYFYQAVQILSNLDGSDDGVCECVERAARLSGEAGAAMERLRVNPALAEVVRNWPLGEDGRLLTVKKKRDEIMGSSSSKDLMTASFDPYVNRRLLGNAPVRKALFRPPYDVIESLSRISRELEWAVCDVLLRGDTMGRVTRMLRSNSLRGCGGAPGLLPAAKAAGVGGGNGTSAAGERRSPMGINVLSRSLLVLNLYFNDRVFGRYDFSSMIGQHMRQVCGVPETLLETRTTWLVRLAKPMYDTLKALCMNRHRERAFTEAVLLPAFSALQGEASGIDNAFRVEHGLDPRTTPSYMTNYVICITMGLMERHVGLGIELGLYPRWYDLSTAFWYRDFLLSALINVRGSIAQECMERKAMELQIKMEEEEVEERLRRAQQQNQKRSGGGKKKGKRGPAGKRPTSPPAASADEKSGGVQAEDFEDKLDYTLLTLHRNVCRGLVRYLAALRQAKLLSDPPATMNMFTSQQRRFEKRFEVFRDMPQPPRLSFEDYQKGSDFSMVNHEDLLGSSSDCFRSGKAIVDRLLEIIVPSAAASPAKISEKREDDDLYIPIRRAEIVALAKVCVTNSLFLHKLSSGNAKGNVCVEFNAHKQYCTLSIT